MIQSFPESLNDSVIVSHCLLADESDWFFLEFLNDSGIVSSGWIGLFLSWIFNFKSMRLQESCSSFYNEKASLPLQSCNNFMILYKICINEKASLPLQTKPSPIIQKRERFISEPQESCSSFYRKGAIASFKIVVII